MTRFATDSFDSIRPDETDYFAFDFNKELGPVTTFIGSISGDTLHVTEVHTGTVRVGYVIEGQGVASPTVIIGLLGNSAGGAGDYRVDTTQTVPSTVISGSAYVIDSQWTCAVSSLSTVTDPTPQARLLSEPSIANNVTTVLVGTMVDGVVYLLTAVATVSDGRQLVSSADVICVLTAVVVDEVLTVAEFRAILPAFSNAAIYPDATIAYWVNQAVTMPVIDANRWGQFYNMGICLWVAHILTLSGAMSNRGPMLGSGVPASKSVNGVSISYDTQLGMEANAGWYALTPWGNAFLHYLRMAGAGPLQIGAGGFWNLPGTVLDVVPMQGVQRGAPFLMRLRNW